MNAPPDVRIFLAFDVEHDSDLGDRLCEQSLAPGSGFHVVSRSNAEEMSEAWCDDLRQRIRETDEIVVICSEYTAASERVSMELRVAQQEHKPCMLLWGRRGRMCAMPPGAEQGARMYTWTWEILVHQVAQTLRDALWSEQRSSAMVEEPAAPALVSDPPAVRADATSTAIATESRFRFARPLPQPPPAQSGAAHEL
jgi:hypothetical protein